MSKWNGIERSPLKPRTTPLSRSRITPKKRKPVRKVNTERAKRRLAAYKAFMCSPEWKAIRAKALKRAGHQCQFVYSNVLVGLYGTGWKSRCLTTHGLHVHHVRYTRFGGRELPRDLKVLCESHHAAAEALKGKVPLWKRAAA